jgi:putative spermidine/putrescine transport system permease protein
VAEQMKNRVVLNLTLFAGFIFVFLPFGSAAEFSFRDGGNKKHSLSAYRWIVQQPDFVHYLLLTIKLTAISVVITVFLMVPTVVWLHLKANSLKPLLEFLTILPLVIPVVALAIGAQSAFPVWLQSTEYELSFMFAILSMPYTYRTLDTGIGAIPLATLTEASRSLGANWFNTILRVIIPTIRAAVVGSIFIATALGLGEFTLTVLLHWDTFPTWVTTVSQQNIVGAIALSIFSLAAAFLILIIINFSLFKSNATAGEGK